MHAGDRRLGDNQHQVAAEILKFDIKPPLVKRDENSSATELKKVTKILGVVGSKTYKVIVKRGTQWDINIDEV